MEMNLPVMVLTGLGALIAILGIFAAGGIELIALGLGAVALAGILQVMGSRKR